MVQSGNHTLNKSTKVLKWKVGQMRVKIRKNYSVLPFSKDRELLLQLTGQHRYRI